MCVELQARSKHAFTWVFVWCTSRFQGTGLSPAGNGRSARTEDAGGHERVKGVLLMGIRTLVSDVVSSRYYRTNPLAAAQLVYAKWVFSRAREYDPVKFLEAKGVDTVTGFAGYDRWATTLESVIHNVGTARGQQGGCSMEDGKILYAITRALKPQTIIETGVAAGVSTSFIGAALIENGHGTLYSIELPPAEATGRAQMDGARFDWAEAGVGWAIPDEIRQGLVDKHHLILEDVRTALPRALREIGRVDVFFHDDLHTPDQMLWEFNLVWPHLTSKGALIADDVNYGWIEFCKQQKLRNANLNVQRLSALIKE
jgi:predicted O-methyltransferase YrrM